MSIAKLYNNVTNSVCVLNTLNYDVLLKSIFYCSCSIIIYLAAWTINPGAFLEIIISRIDGRKLHVILFGVMVYFVVFFNLYIYKFYILIVW